MVRALKQAAIKKARGHREEANDISFVVALYCMQLLNPHQICTWADRKTEIFEL